MPTITWLVSAALLPSKPRFQGATIAHRPSSRLAHSSHSVNASNAAIATSAISPPQIHAFQPAVLPAKPKIHGVTNSHAPRIKLTTSTNASLRHFCMCIETSVTKADPLAPEIIRNRSVASTCAEPNVVAAAQRGAASLTQMIGVTPSRDQAAATRRRGLALTVRTSSVPHCRQPSVTSSKSSASGVGATDTILSGCPQQGQGTTIEGLGGAMRGPYM